MLDQLRLDSTGIVGMREHVLLQFDCRLPQANLQQNDSQCVYVVNLLEHLRRLALAVWMAVDVARRLKVRMPHGEERLWTTELEAKNPRLWIVHCDTGTHLFIIDMMGQEQDIVASETLVQLSGYYYLRHFVGLIKISAIGGTEHTHWTMCI